jgi:hypothetical protein
MEGFGHCVPTSLSTRRGGPCKNSSLSKGLCASRIPSPPAAGRCKARKEKWRSSKLDAIFSVLCGERGIRTPGSFHFNSFQDCRFKPLTHLSFCLGVQRYIKKTFTQKKAYFAGSDSSALEALEKNFHLKISR